MVNQKLVTEAAHNRELARQHSRRGAFDQAEACCRAALKYYERVYGTVHPEVAGCLADLGEILAGRREWTAVLDCAQRSIRIVEELNAVMNPSEVAGLLTQNLVLVGIALRELGRFGEAELPLLRAIEVAGAHAGIPLLLGCACNNLGVLYKCIGRYDEALQLYSQALQLVVANDRAVSAHAATIHHNIADLEGTRGRFDNALNPARTAFQIRRKLLGPEDPKTLSDASALADILDSLGRHTESLPIYAQTLKCYQRLYGPEHQLIADTLSRIAAVEEAGNRFAASERMYRRALEMKTHLLGEQHPDVAVTMFQLALLLNKRAAVDEARTLATCALENLTRALAPDHPQVIACETFVSSVAAG